MKNNQGFTLLGLMAIAALLSVIAVTGITIVKNKANQQAASETAANANRITSSVVGGAGASLGAVSKAEFQKLPNGLNDVDPNLTDNSMYDPNNSDNPNHPSNPNHPNNTGTPAPGGDPKGCPEPCHLSADPNNNNIQTCMLTDADCACLGYCPMVPQGCVYVPSGPLHLKYQPAPQGLGVACPGSPIVPDCHRVPTAQELANGIASWNDGDLLQCGCSMDSPCPVEPIGKNNTCPAGKTPQCLCPGGISDCPDVPVCAPGYVLSQTNPWVSTCVPAGIGGGAVQVDLGGALNNK